MDLLAFLDQRRPGQGLGRHLDGRVYQDQPGKTRQRPQRRQNLRELPLIGKDQGAGGGVIQDEANLFCEEGGVQRDYHRADVQEGMIKRHPFGAVLREQRHPLSPLDPQGL